MTTPRTNRDPGAKREGLGHVGYEVWMCCLAAAEQPEAWAAADAEPSNFALAARANALLEAQLLHARSLIEFLIRPAPKQPGADDMLRTDFAEEWDPAPAASAGRLNSQWQGLNRYLSHLSWERLDPKGWDASKISTDVLAVTRAWADHVSAKANGIDLTPLRMQLLAAQKLVADL